MVQPAWVADTPQSGRPSKQTPEVREFTEQAIQRDGYGREKSAEAIRQTIKECTSRTVLESTIWRILRQVSYRKTKPTRKLGLNAAQKAARLKWCLEHVDWTLEDWKRVIWTDETSVVLGQRRSGYRL